MNRLAGARAPWIVAGAVIAAVAVNLAIYAVGRGLGGTFTFTSPTGPAHVDPLTLIGFTAVPLTLGLAALALVGRWWNGAFLVALVVAPVIELGSILIMTLPTDLDPISKVTLAACHVALVPVTVVAVLALRARAVGRRADGIARLASRAKPRHETDAATAR